MFLAGSVFLAFAYLNPDFEIVLFFILPVKIQWLALFAWASYAAFFVIGAWAPRLRSWPPWAISFSSSAGTSG